MNEIESYIYGLLVTDGNLYLTSRNRGRVTLEISEKDTDIIDKLVSLIPKSRKRRRTRSTNFKKNVNFVSFTNYQKEFRDNLIKEGYPTSNKTENANAPIVSYDEVSFWRGVIDGDGSIGITSNGEPFVSFATKSEKLKNEYLDFLNKRFNIVKHINRNTRDNIYNIMVMNQHAVNLSRLLYFGSSIHLKRKYDLAIKINNCSNKTESLC